MSDRGLYQSRFGALGRFGKRVILRVFRFMLVRQIELEGRISTVERWLPAIEGSRVLAREANAGLSALTARLSALQAENEAIREELTQLRAEIRLRTDVADLSNGQRP